MLVIKKIDDIKKEPRLLQNLCTLTGSNVDPAHLTVYDMIVDLWILL